MVKLNHESPRTEDHHPKISIHMKTVFAVIRVPCSWLPAVKEAVKPAGVTCKKDKDGIPEGMEPLTATVYCDRYIVFVSDGTDDPAFAYENMSTPNGTISYHRWNGISGDKVSDLTSDPDYPDNPDATTTLNSFEVPGDVANTSAAAYRATFTPS